LETGSATHDDFYGLEKPLLSSLFVLVPEGEDAGSYGSQDNASR
jgi:hypothetical protein